MHLKKNKKYHILQNHWDVHSNNMYTRNWNIAHCSKSKIDQKKLKVTIVEQNEFYQATFLNFPHQDINKNKEWHLDK